MQELIAELIRWIGYFALKGATLGQYRGGSSGDELHEGALGLALIALISYAAVRLSS